MQTRILQALFVWERFAERKWVGSVKKYDRPCDLESVEDVGSPETQQVIEKESGKDARKGDVSMDGLDGSLSS